MKKGKVFKNNYSTVVAVLVSSIMAGTVVNYNDEAVMTKYGKVGAEDYILADMTGAAQTSGGDTSEE